MEILAKAVGRRKEAVAQVHIKVGTGQFIINNKPAQEYLQNDFYSLLSVKAPFDVVSSSKQNDKSDETFRPSTSPDLSNSLNYNLKLDTIVKVKGGGLMGQTEAIRLGISRALCVLASNKPEFSTVAENTSANTNELLPLSNLLDIRKQFKDKGYLTQDSRVKERRKYGLKKARKASQYHKR
jgi:small subunit ribosomal protein S9